MSASERILAACMQVAGGGACWQPLAQVELDTSSLLSLAVVILLSVLGGILQQQKQKRSEQQKGATPTPTPKPRPSVRTGPTAKPAASAGGAQRSGLPRPPAARPARPAAAQDLQPVRRAAPSPVPVPPRPETYRPVERRLAPLAPAEPLPQVETYSLPLRMRESPPTGQKPAPQPAAQPKSDLPDRLRQVLQDRTNLQTAFILSEILRPPLSIREDHL